MSDITVLEDGVYEVNRRATDADEDVITYSAKSDPNTVNAEIIVEYDMLKLTPNPNWNGVATITAYASDGWTGKDSTSFKLTVTAVNDAPIISDIGSVSSSLSFDGSNDFLDIESGFWIDIFLNSFDCLSIFSTI